MNWLMVGLELLAGGGLFFSAGFLDSQGKGDVVVVCVVVGFGAMASGVSRAYACGKGGK